MTLEGVVTNVTAFGAFVDVGVHQDGLVHISQLADRFVKDPREVVQVGDKLTVRVLDVDLERKRISLSARSGERPAGGDRAAPAERRGGSGGQGVKDKGVRGTPPGPARGRGPQKDQGRGRVKENRPGFGNTPFADLLKK